MISRDIPQYMPPDVGQVVAATIALWAGDTAPGCHQTVYNVASNDGLMPAAPNTFIFLSQCIRVSICFQAHPPEPAVPFRVFTA